MRHVASHELGPAARVADPPDVARPGFLVDIDNQHTGAIRGESSGATSADAERATGNNRASPVKSAHRFSSLRPIVGE